jgi:hypothetical protein
MTEQETGGVRSLKADVECRSLLLMPVVEGHTLESEDVSSFLGIRLSSSDDEGEPRLEPRLS